MADTVPPIDEANAPLGQPPIALVVVAIVVLVAVAVLGFCALTDRWVFAPEDPCGQKTDCPTFGT